MKTTNKHIDQVNPFTIKKERCQMPWKLKYQNEDDDLVSIDFQTKNEMDEYIKEHSLESAWKVTEQVRSVIPAEKE